MTLQQLQYIVALDNFRHFAKAAEACGVTQSTLSLMIKNLENELDTVIFNRNAHPIQPTPLGEKIIAQAKVTLYNAQQLEEIPKTEKNEEKGEIRMGIIPTIAPYLLPELFTQMRMFPDVHLKIEERQTSAVVEKLKKAELDMAILATPLKIDGLLEIPLYYEKFFAYVAPSDPLFQQEKVSSDLLPGENLWLLQEGHCFRNQIINLCSNTRHAAAYQAGSIDTLIRVVDTNGGHTIIPELHLELLQEHQRQCVRPIEPADAVREVSLVIRDDYAREGLLNVIASAVKRIIPEDMLDSRLKKYAIRI